MVKSNKKVFIVVTYFMLTGTLFLLSPQRSYAQLPSGGLPLCIETLISCITGLNTCEDELNTCNTDLNTCGADLNTCNADLNTCGADLSTCNTDLNTCDADLSTCNTGLNTCDADLSTCNADLNTVEGDLNTCNENLNTCEADLAECEAEGGQIFPGDGYPNPDAFGVSGHGPALSYADNGDGTFTDNNTGLMWEKKEELTGGIHDVSNAYTWTDTGDGDLTNPDGTLFTQFLSALNNSCDGAGVDDCETDADCVFIGNEVCGFLGHQDWRIPNVKELQSIVDYSVIDPASSVPGLTQSSTNTFYWSSTTFANLNTSSLVVDFEVGVIVPAPKDVGGFARAVRP